jgi:CubicO group peptidase (beta-lactamase class C family)
VTALSPSLSLAGAQSAPVAYAEVARQAQATLAEAAKPGAPGVAVLVAKGEAVLFKDAVGRAQMDLGTPLSTDQVFQIASVTKMFTAATVMTLVEAGKVSLDDRLATYLPAFPAGEEITIRQLLNHTAGVSDKIGAPIPGFSRRDLDTATLVPEIGKRPADFPAGSRWSYSNAGYILLGAVIEKVAGKPWHEVVDERVVAPLGLTHTLFGADAPLITGRVAGYRIDGTGAITNAPYLNLSAPAAAGGLVSSVGDLRLWLRALATGRIVTKSSFEAMAAPPDDLPGIVPAGRYGLGLYLWQVRGSVAIGHSGQIAGFASMAVHLPVEDVTVVVLANHEEFDAQTMGRRLAAIALGDPYPEIAPVTPPARELAALAGVYRYYGDREMALSVRDGTVYFQRGTGKPIPLQATAAGRLHFVPDDLSYFVPVRDGAGKVTRLDFFARGEEPPRAMPRVE